MLELNFVGRSLALVKVVHIELTYKRIQIAVFEIGRECLICETISIEHLKAEAVGCPLNGPGLQRVIDDFEQFLKEGRY